MCLYLTKVGATYYFRRPVPDDLRGHFLTKTGKERDDWKETLRTKDIAEAKRKRHVVAHKYDLIIEATRRELSKHAPDDVQAPSYEMSDAQARWLEENTEGIWELESEFRATEYAALEYEEQLKRPQSSEQRLAAWLLREERERGDRYRGRYQRRKARDAQTAESPLPTAYPMTVPAPGIPLLATFDTYAAVQDIKPATRAEWRASVEKLIAFVGHDDARRLTVEDLDRWRDSLIGGETSRGTPRAPRTVKGNYINPVRAVLNYAIEKRWLEKNVASKVIVRVPKKAKLRERDFTPDEARAILGATFMPMDKRTSESSRLARRWIPWLCAYTGARVNELSQMRRQDVKQVEGMWCITITPEAGTVKANEARTVPLHPHLIEQGFPAAALARPDAALFYDPERRRKEGATRHVKKVGERLRDWIRDDVGITDPNVQPNHGWRHTFKTLAMEAQIPERVADAIQGHAPKSVGQTYGRVSLTVMHEAIQRLPRFDVGRAISGTGKT